MKARTMQRTKIEWADFSYNPVVGCSKVSDGCLNCYAEAMVHRFPWMTGTHYPDDTGNNSFGWDGNAHFFPERLEEPFRLRPGKNRPHRIFVCSMSDLFHESLSNEQIAAVFGVMAATPHHQYVVLTKRLQHALEWCAWADRHFDGLNTVRKLFPEIAYQEILRLWLTLNLSVKYTVSIPNNVIIGASVENQKAADERIPLLLQIPARWRGVSVEPMLERIQLRHMDIDIGEFYQIDALTGRNTDMGRPCKDVNSLDLVICGAETGPGKRLFKDEWALDLLEQCRVADVPFFFKKDGNGNPTLCGVEYHEWIKE
jgi:protein gp37